MESPGTAPAVQVVTWPAGAVARMLDLPPSTLRAWHRRYDLPLSAPQTGAHRRYGSADVRALVRMKHLIEQGFSAGSAASRAFDPGRGADVELLLDAVTRLDTETSIALLEAQLNADGVVATWDGLCRPALEALGGPATADPDHCIDLVHVLTWAITVALHRVPAPVGTGAMVLLACADGDRHTLPLEALRAALAEHGRAALLLGASIPEGALRDAIQRTHPAAVVVWSSQPAQPPRLRDKARLVLAGPGWPARGPRARRPESLGDAVTLLTARE
ncbi:MerR family transcriptional regulator [Amycolatopsis sp., V23-08]|uniref:MerR family transcriptional regulator n=1 Tax=Amycolatopsis heterodermiae TaxID=3110235 RepID=A0ABU5RG94_9PSEU|nr:MerR family transcriptional regulator [Amycolatopsis sp., V23-08]MEA5364161.1 MerR family transcriptional regulator [Amycolatopsis sp., V23-08]